MAEPKTISTKRTRIAGSKRRGFVNVLIEKLQEMPEPKRACNQIWDYTPAFGAMICEAIQEGMTISEIGALKGFPSRAEIFRWSEKYPDFKEMMSSARKSRAEFYHDKALDEASRVREDNSKAKKIHIDTLKWAASKNDPLVYGDIKKEVGENAAGGVNIYINTGIVRELPKPVEAIDVTQEVNVNTDKSDGKTSS